jgi:hypothetical protein
MEDTIPCPRRSYCYVTAETRSTATDFSSSTSCLGRTVVAHSSPWRRSTTIRMLGPTSSGSAFISSGKSTVSLTTTVLRFSTKFPRLTPAQVGLEILGGRQRPCRSSDPRKGISEVAHRERGRRSAISQTTLGLMICAGAWTVYWARAGSLPHHQDSCRRIFPSKLQHMDALIQGQSRENVKLSPTRCLTSWILILFRR